MYDPLTSQTIPAFHEAGMATYWQAVTPFPDTDSVALPAQADVVVIGAGYTGLNAAVTLAKDYNKQVVLLEAGSIGAGASSRNAGFLLPGTGRLGFQDYRNKFGVDVAQAVQNEFAASISHVHQAIDASDYHCDFTHARYLRVAHNAKAAQTLQQQQPAYQPTLLDAEWLTADTLKQQIPGLPWGHGGLALTPAAALNPRALTAVYLEQAKAAGVSVVTGHPVTHWQALADGLHQLEAAGSTIRCQQVLVCTNGYLPGQPFADIAQRQFPVLSSILVSRPLNAVEQQMLGLTVNDLVMDTRLLKYYYRLLPDGRILFGGRGAVRGKDADSGRQRQRLERALVQTFPQLEGLYADYFWSGWISVALDSLPRVFSPSTGVYTSAGYCGAGVAFASLAGKRLAQLAAGETLPALPFYQSPLPKYPMPQLRRVALRGLYQWQRWFGS